MLIRLVFRRKLNWPTLLLAVSLLFLPLGAAMAVRGCTPPPAVDVNEHNPPDTAPAVSPLPVSVTLPFRTQATPRKFSLIAMLPSAHGLGLCLPVACVRGAP